LNLDFVPPDLEFVPAGLDFVPKNLDFVPVDLEILHRAGQSASDLHCSGRASGFLIVSTGIPVSPSWLRPEGRDSLDERIRAILS
jgi:hypothetical protein